MRVHIYIFLLIPLLVSNCNNGTYNGNENEVIFSKSNSPYHIQKDLIVDSSKKVIIQPGVEMVFHNNSKIEVKGSIVARGKKDNPIIFKSSSADSSWGGIRILQPSDSCFFSESKMENGLIYGEDANITFQNCTIVNNIRLGQFDALIRLFRGNVQVLNSSFLSNHTGEGLLFHDMKTGTTLVANCYFNGVSDAVEYISVENGVIKKNRFYNIQQKYGDGIDLNGSKYIRIEENIFNKIIDFGIENGNDKYGSSENTLIINNLFVECGKGIVTKGGSTAIVINCTFYKNNFGVSCMVEHYGSNFEPNSIDVINSIFCKSQENDFQNNDNSKIVFRNSLSDNQLFVGISNLYSDPDFLLTKEGDLRLSEKSPCLVNGDSIIAKKYGFNTIDIGSTITVY